MLYCANNNAPPPRTPTHQTLCLSHSIVPHFHIKCAPSNNLLNFCLQIEKILFRFLRWQLHPIQSEWYSSMKVVFMKKSSNGSAVPKIKDITFCRAMSSCDLFRFIDFHFGHVLLLGFEQVSCSYFPQANEEEVFLSSLSTSSSALL